MAEVADLHHHLPQEEEIETLGSAPYWYSFCDHDDDDIYSSYEPDPDEFDPFSPLNFDSFDHSLHTQIIFDERETCVELVGSDEEEDGSGSDSILEHDNQVNIVFNLFERCNQEEDETHVIDGDDDNRLRIFDENDEMGANYVELGLGSNREIGDLNDDDDNSSFMLEEFGGDNYHVSRRDTGESSDVRNVETFQDGGLRIVGIGSDSDSEDGIFGIGFHSGEEDDDGFDCGPEDSGLQLRWDSLRLEEAQRELSEDFEWEEVDERADEREVMNMMIDAEVGRLVSTEMLSGEVGEGGGETMTRTLEWEVLLAVNNLDRNVELEHEGGHDGYIYPTEYETLFGQVAEHDSFIRGNPPAARTVIENLTSVVVTQEDVENKSAICAVCKDEMGMEEQVKKLPCSHCYHGDCILPWLGMRNTCPVCRYELPTDDPDYERMRTRRLVDRGVSRDDYDQVRYEIFYEQ
ncbi:hypothetical protein MKW98_017467 [Papaver atlanticum]|uniref:RING-type E3 ubiquitin transferase n=1 Tax=Papaver atlanticum TaxID=357466 RepID=A0AAD4TE53_9MAGN|nr:hypothetical protein MKW98_017467 [Papaver atlanticum]